VKNKKKTRAGSDRSIPFHLYSHIILTNLEMQSNSTRGVEAFLKKTAIAYGPDPSKKAKFWWYAIAVFFKNASTPRVRGGTLDPLVLQSPWCNAMRNEGKSNHMDEGWKLGKEEKVNGELTLEQNVPGVGSPRPPFMAHCTTKCFPPVSCSRALFTGIRPIIRYRGYDESQWPNCSVIHLAVLSSSRSPT